jgi:hypothetical protein
VFSIAAISGTGCRELVYAIQDWLDAHPAMHAETPEPAGAPVVLTPAPVAPRRRRAARTPGSDE